MSDDVELLEQRLAATQAQISDLASKLDHVNDRWRVLESERHEVRFALGAADVETMLQAAERAVREREAAQLRRADDIAVYHTIESDLASNHRRADAAERDLTAAQQRIAELEAEESRLNEVLIDHAEERSDLTAALRAILPVYWAAIDEYPCTVYPTPYEAGKACSAAVAEAVDAAQAAITPEIAAVLADLDGK